jgi:L-ascorbate metabolism protein UlaG (beta-lactamase superfamily)
MTRKPAEITFIGNEGVVIATPSATVAIDALFGHGAHSFTITPDAVIDAIEAARPPFDSIDLILATHFHPDHFNPRAVARHLESNERARLVTTGQAVDLLERRAGAFHSISDRVYAARAEEGVVDTLELGGVRVEAFGLSHGKVNYADVEHLGFRVSAGGFQILHLGDGIIDTRALTGAGVLDTPLDMAFLPFWYLTYPVGAALVRNRLCASRVFAVHIPPHRHVEIETVLSADHPDSVAMTRAMTVYRVE